MAADLRKRGARFAGSVSLFSYLQAVGVVNSHVPGCFCYAEIVAAGGGAAPHERQGTGDTNLPLQPPVNHPACDEE